jgi:curved DNA-binding protein CbpA
MDPYEVLEVSRDARPEVIKAAYRHHSRKWHPDKGGDADRMAQINLAYEILKDPQRRKQYDTTGQTVEIPLENIARSRIVSMFLEAGRKNSWRQGNYILAMRRAVDSGQAEIRSKVAELELTHSLMDEMIPKSFDADNIFVGAVRQQQETITKDLATADRELQVGDLILELLEPYEDNLPPQQFAQSFFFSTGSSTSSGTGGF